MYYYAVMTLAIKSVTHKFLIRGHTQNEGDTAHSLIEKAIKKAKRTGPIYVPDQYVQVIRGAKKTGKPFKVHELNFDDFIDTKKLTEDLGLNFAKDVNGDVVKLTEIKMIRFVKDSESYFVKYAYDSCDWTEVSVKIKKSGRASRKQVIYQICLVVIFLSRLFSCVIFIFLNFNVTFVTFISGNFRKL